MRREYLSLLGPIKVMSFFGGPPLAHKDAKFGQVVSESIRSLYGVYFWERPAQDTSLGTYTYSLFHSVHSYIRKFQNTTIGDLDALFESLIEGILEFISEIKQDIDCEVHDDSQVTENSTRLENERDAGLSAFEDSPRTRYSRFMRYFTQLVDLITVSADRYVRRFLENSSVHSDQAQHSSTSITFAELHDNI